MAHVIHKREGFFAGSGRRGDYGRLVAWVEKKYGGISKGDCEEEVKAKFSKALREAEQPNPKMAAGLRKYVELGKYRGLIKKE